MKFLWNADKPKPIYCGTCGHKLEPDESIMGYDEQTGKPIKPFMTQLRCPNKYCDKIYRGWG